MDDQAIGSLNTNVDRSPAEQQWSALNAGLEPGSVATLPSTELLLRRLQRELPHPWDELQVAAFLESWGITDSVVRRGYGCEDVFQLATSLYHRLTQQERPIPPRASKQRAEGISRLTFFEDLLQGPLSALPVLAWVVLVAIALDINDPKDSNLMVLGLAPSLSLLVTWGFAQAMAYRVLRDISRGDPAGASRLLVRMVLVSVAVVAAFGVAIAGVAAAVKDLSIWELVEFTAVYFLKSLISLGLACVIVAGRHLGIGLSLLPGIGAGLITFLLLTLLMGWDQEQRQLALRLAVLAGCLSLLLTCYYLTATGLRQYMRQAPTRTEGYTPKVDWLVFALAPYFVYGLLFALLTVLTPTIDWFRGLILSPEHHQTIGVLGLGMTVTILPYLFTLGISEHALRQFWQAYRRLSENLTIDSSGALTKAIQDIRVRYRIYLLLALVVANETMYLILQWASNSGPKALTDLMEQGRLVVGMGLLGYTFLALAVLDCSLFVSLSRPRLAIKALGIAILTLLALAVPLSWVGYQYVSVGFAAGTAAFLVVSFLEARKLFQKPDLAYYTSF